MPVNACLRTAVCRAFAFALLQFSVSLPLSAQTPAQPYVADGDVKAIAKKDNTLYIGGDFTHVGPNMPFGAPVNSTTGTPDLNFAVPNQLLTACAPDGAGGWYIGGFFSEVGGFARNGLARINASGAVTSFNANLNAGGYVRSIVVSGSTVYIGGGFSSAGGVARINFAAIDAASGAVVPGIAPAFNSGPVSCLLLSGSTLYAGGYFTGVNNNASYRRLAAINTATGTLVSGFAPAPDRPVDGLALSGATLYAVGVFDNIGGGAKSDVAALNASTGALINSFTSTSSIYPYDVAVAGGVVYVAGINGLYAMDAATGASLPSAAPVVKGTVLTVKASGNNIFIGGIFDTVGGLRRPNIAQFATGGAVASFAPNPRGAVRTIGFGAGSLYIGGEFATIGATPRKYLAALDATTGVPIAGTNLDADSQVNALLLSGTTLYAGGEFTTLGGAVHNRLAAVNTATNTVISGFTANADEQVRALAISGSSLYAGGDFKTMGGLSRAALAAVNATSGSPLAGFDAQLDDGYANMNLASVWALAVSGSNLYLGGSYIGTVGGTQRNNLAAVNATSGALVTGFAADTYGEVAALAVSGNTLYAGGNFQTIGGAARNYFVQLNLSTGVPTALNIPANNSVRSFALSGGTLYIGGYFETLGGAVHDGLAALDVASGTLVPGFNPKATAISSILVAGNVLYAGGLFSTVNNVPRRGIVALNVANGTVLPVTLRSFTAVAAGAGNRIDWSTATETGSNRFAVERSGNGSGFALLGTLPGKGSQSAYSFFDAVPLAGLNYYRLKTTDESGVETYSSIAVVRNGSMGGSITVAPVPSGTEVVITNTDAALNGEAAAIYSMDGRVMTQFSLQARQQVDIRSWPSGGYLLRLPAGGTVRIVRQ